MIKNHALKTRKFFEIKDKYLLFLLYTGKIHQIKRDINFQFKYQYNTKEILFFPLKIGNFFKIQRKIIFLTNLQIELNLEILYSFKKDKLLLTVFYNNSTYFIWIPKPDCGPLEFYKKAEEILENSYFFPVKEKYFFFTEQMIINKKGSLMKIIQIRKEKFHCTVFGTFQLIEEEDHIFVLIEYKEKKLVSKIWLTALPALTLESKINVLNQLENLQEKHLEYSKVKGLFVKNEFFAQEKIKEFVNEQKKHRVYWEKTTENIIYVHGEMLEKSVRVIQDRFRYKRLEAVKEGKRFRRFLRTIKTIQFFFRFKLKQTEKKKRALAAKKIQDYYRKKNLLFAQSKSLNLIDEDFEIIPKKFFNKMPFLCQIYLENLYESSILKMKNVPKTVIVIDDYLRSLYSNCLIEYRINKKSEIEKIKKREKITMKYLHRLYKNAKNSYLKNLKFTIMRNKSVRSLKNSDVLEKIRNFKKIDKNEKDEKDEKNEKDENITKDKNFVKNRIFEKFVKFKKNENIENIEKNEKYEKNINCEFIEKKVACRYVKEITWMCYNKLFDKIFIEKKIAREFVENLSSRCFFGVNGLIDI